jgi:uncharacterized membrane protein
MNTVFKFYLQSWTLLAVGSAVLVVWLWRDARIAGLPQRPLGIVADTAHRTRPSTSVRSRTIRPARVAAAASAVLLAAGMLYPLIGTPVRLDWDMDSSPTGLTLDGYAWMDGGQILNGTGDAIDFSGDLAAIEWFDQHVDGTPVILEASIGPYRGNGSRISSATGLPAVLGWDRHQRQQRYEPGITQRMVGVREIYNETDPAVKLEDLRRYDVRYVIVGDVERYWNTPENPTYYASTEGLAAFDQLLGNGLQLAFESGHTRVYQVLDFSRIAPAPGAVAEL